MKQTDNRDSIDFGRTDITRLFAKVFIPTLLGLMFGASVYLADGIFVGNGVGSDALAAVNIVSPLFLISTGLGLMFGSGVSIVAAIHLSKGNYKAANINVTQALSISIIAVSLLCVLILAFPQSIARMFGSSEKLFPLVLDYMFYALPSFFGTMLLVVGMFVIRLDGAPKFAMLSNIVASLLNIFLDYLFVFPMGMGIKGAAIATSVSQCAGAVMVIIYMLYFPKTICLYKPKFSRTAIRLTYRNIGYMVKLGFPAFIGETALACTMIVGNIMFMKYLHEDGVAAFSVACYLTPLVFMFGNAIAQSALPIISYNHGMDNRDRIRRTLDMSLKVAAVFGILACTVSIFGKDSIVGLFIPDNGLAARIADGGFSYYSLCFAFLLLNLVLIGYLQSMERFKPATVFMLLRSYILVIPSFIILPMLIGDKGLWLAVPVSECLTFICILLYMASPVKRHLRTIEQNHI